METEEQDYTWLREEIGTGFQMLLSLRLSGCPSEEIVQLTAEVWLDGLTKMNVTWDEEIDAERMQEAFSRLSVECKEWPSIRLFLEMMPSRPQPKVLPPPALSHAESKEVLKRFGLTKDFIGSKIAQNKIDEQKEKIEAHHKWLASMRQRQDAIKNLHKLTGDK